ncbi:HAD-IA family hydrolase [Paenibacillus luteus]|uniref:HAD-IA family hydrolase n=1 Tax=Paenibacillus luteus TaxID=2545753 RepID=UPI0011411380|nr:HAD-IA family hydrolase [Paenibacillus luteus]
MRPQLVLDIGGVLATNLSPLFWQLLAAETVLSEEALYCEYKNQISSQLWTGEISEHDFWHWVSAYAPLLTQEHAKTMIDRSLQPLPALRKIAAWSKIADIHLLSNHLSGWVANIIQPIQPYLKSITISSQTALKKPDPAIFNKAAYHFPRESYILFIDDQSKNVAQAALHGWHTMLADEAGLWISLVQPLLEQALEQASNDN